MTLQIGDTAPDFEADTTAGRIRFHDWMDGKWAVLFSHPKDFTPVCTTELGYMAKIKPEFDKRGVKIIELSVDPVDRPRRLGRRHQGDARLRAELSDDRRHRPTTISKLYGMLPAAVSRRPARSAPPADNQTVRNVFVIGPDKKIKLILVYPMTTGRNFDEVLRVIDSLQTDREAQGRDAGELEAGRGRDHRRLGLRRGRQEDVSAGLEGAEALHPHRGATALTRRSHRRRQR